MNILSIDTSGLSFSLTISDGRTYCEYIGESGISSSEKVLIEIDKLTKNIDISPKDIGCIIFNNGPGSFTGVRVSSAVAQAIGFSNNCPVYGINSLSLIAYNTFKESKERQIQVVKNAFGTQVFHGLFTINNKKIISDSIVSTMSYSDVEINDDYILVSDRDEIANSNASCFPIKNIMGANLQIEYFEIYVDKKKNFDYKDALPSYAGHVI